MSRRAHENLHGERVAAVEVVLGACLVEDEAVCAEVRRCVVVGEDEECRNRHEFEDVLFQHEVLPRAIFSLGEAAYVIISETLRCCPPLIPNVYW